MSQDLSVCGIKLEPSHLVPELYRFSYWNEWNKEGKGEEYVPGQEKSIFKTRGNDWSGEWKSGVDMRDVRSEKVGISQLIWFLLLNKEFELCSEIMGRLKDFSREETL